MADIDEAMQPTELETVDDEVQDFRLLSISQWALFSRVCVGQAISGRPSRSCADLDPKSPVEAKRTLNRMPRRFSQTL